MSWAIFYILYSCRQLTDKTQDSRSTTCTSPQILQNSVLFSVPFPSIWLALREHPRLGNRNAASDSKYGRLISSHPQRQQPLLPTQTKGPTALSSHHILGGPRVRPRAQPRIACWVDRCFSISFPLQELGGELDIVFMKSCVPQPSVSGCYVMPPAAIFCCPLYVCPVGHGHSDQVNYICVIK